MDATSARSLDDLLDEHVSEIDALRDALAGVLPASGQTADGVVVDDIFLLRFLLSAKKSVSAAAGKAREALAWRAKNCALLTSLADGGAHPLDRDVSQFLFSGMSGCLARGEPVSVVRMGSSDFRALMTTFGVDEVAQFLLFEKERIFRICDRETRARRHMVKSVTVIDFAGFSMFGGRFDNRFFSALGASSKLSSALFPQLQAKTVAINTPTYYGMVHRTLSAVMPRSSMDKMVMCPAKKTHTQSCDACPFMRTMGGAGAVPDFLGGTAPTPRTLQTPDAREGEVPFITVRIASRGYAVVALPIERRETMVEFEAMVDGYHVLLAAELVQERSGISNVASLQPSALSALSDAAAEEENDDDDDEGDDDDREDDDAVTRSPSATPAPQVQLHKQSRGERKQQQRKHRQRNKHKQFKQRSARVLEPGDAPNLRDARRFSLNPTMAPMRLSAADGMVKGAWRMPLTGTLLVRFDNTFSKLRPKKVTFRITTVAPPEDEVERSWWEQNWEEFANSVRWPADAADDWQCSIS